MFNRQPFNRGKFNTSSIQSVGNSGISLMVLGANSVLASKIISANGIANIGMKSSADGTNVKYNNGASHLMLGSSSDGTKEFISTHSTANIVLQTQANQTLSGEQVINLDGITLKPGDELIINTCDMTVTVNGQNAMEYFNNESEFFTLLNGTNTLEYNDTSANGNISFDVIWKDRWL